MEKIMSKITLLGTEKNLMQFLSSVPKNLCQDWEIKKISDTNYDFYYNGNLFLPFRITLIILNGEYILKYVIPTDTDSFDYNMAYKCMNFYLNSFENSFNKYNIKYDISYIEENEE